jgi:hypothetical protein
VRCQPAIRASAALAECDYLDEMVRDREVATGRFSRRWTVLAFAAAERDGRSLTKNRPRGHLRGWGRHFVLVETSDFPYTHTHKGACRTVKTSSRAVAVVLTLLVLVLAPSGARAADRVPRFGFIAPGWLQPLNISMTPFWSAAGLPETGTNYYSAGAPASPSTPFWERFDPSSRLYQAWFGTYVVDNFQFASEWNHPIVSVEDIPNSVQRVFALATIDQVAWLTGFQDPHPSAALVSSSVVVVPMANGYFLAYGQIQSHSDVGGTIPSFPFYPPYATRSSMVSTYANVTLNATLLFKCISSTSELVIIYSSATQWTTLDGVSHSTPPSVTAMQLAMMAATSFPQ